MFILGSEFPCRRLNSLIFCLRIIYFTSLVAVYILQSSVLIEEGHSYRNLFQFFPSGQFHSYTTLVYHSVCLHVGPLHHVVVSVLRALDVHLSLRHVVPGLLSALLLLGVTFVWSREPMVLEFTSAQVVLACFTWWPSSLVSVVAITVFLSMVAVLVALSLDIF